VYAGDPERISMKHAFPQIVELEQRYGSIIRGQIATRHEASSERPKMFSFDEGLEVLPNALASALGNRVITDAPVSAVDLVDGRWQIASPSGTDSFDAVLYCGPLHRLDGIALPSAHDARQLASVTYPPLSVVALGYRRADVAHPLDGFGVLVPRVEREMRILGTLFTSSIFPGRAPAGEVLLTTFVGGMRSPELAGKEKEELFEIVHQDLGKLLGASSPPVFRKHVFWKHAIPQYLMGYENVLEVMTRMESKMSGWFMAGNYRGGVSVGDAAASGIDAARHCASFLRT
jgi:oxygen-dependent protoporphyrinogen oxidase